TDFLQLHGQRFSLFEPFKKTFPLLAAKADKCRHNLNAFRRMIVPVGEGLAAMRRLDQTDTGSPCNHCEILLQKEKMKTYFFLGTAAQASISISMSGKSIPTSLSNVAGRGCARKSGSFSSKNLYISSRMSKTSSLRLRK